MKRLSFAMKEAVETEIDRMEKNDISNSALNGQAQ